MNTTLTERTLSTSTIDDAITHFSQTVETALQELCTALRASYGSAQTGETPTGGAPTSEELTTVEVAKLLRVSRLYVVKLVKTGKLRARKVGRNRLIPREAVIEYKQRQYEQTKAIAAQLSKLAGDELRQSLNTTNP